MQLGEKGMKTSPFFAAEAAGVLGALRVSNKKKDQVHHWCDNEGVVKVLSNSTEVKSIVREHKQVVVSTYYFCGAGCPGSELAEGWGDMVGHHSLGA